MSRTIVYSRTARSFHNPFTGLGVSLVFGQTMSVSGGLEALFETQNGSESSSHHTAMPIHPLTSAVFCS